MAAYDRQVRAAQRAQEITAAGTALTAMLAAHQQSFPQAIAPTVLPAPPVDVTSIQTRCAREELAGIHWWRLADRKAAKERARVRADEEITTRGRELEEQRADQQRHLDEEWGRLLGNDPHTVIMTLDEAFGDNDAPATAVDVDGDRATVVMLMDGEDSVPEKKPALTPSGKPTLHQISKTDRSDLYRGWVYSNVLATVREALAVAPQLGAVTVVVLRREPPTPYGEHPLSAIYAGTMARERCDRIDWKSPAAVNAVLDADDLLIAAKGRTKSLVPIDLAQRLDLAEVVRAFEATLRGPIAAISDRETGRLA
jgi:hypothetical protein